MVAKKHGIVDSVTMVSLESPWEYLNFIRSPRPSVLIFLTNWCGDCLYLTQYFPTIEKRFQNSLDFASLDAEAFPDQVQMHHVLGVPSLILFQESQEIFRFVTTRRKTAPEVADFLEKGLQLIAHRRNYGNSV